MIGIIGAIANMARAIPVCLIQNDPLPKNAGLMRAVIASATCLGLLPNPVLSSPLRSAERAAAWIYKLIGENPAVQCAINSAFGQGTPQASGLLSLPAKERGLKILRDESITSQFLSSGGLTEKQQLGLAGAANMLHLSEPHGTSARLLGFQGAAPEAALVMQHWPVWRSNGRGLSPNRAM